MPTLAAVALAVVASAVMAGTALGGYTELSWTCGHYDGHVWR